MRQIIFRVRCLDSAGRLAVDSEADSKVADQRYLVELAAANLVDLRAVSVPLSRISPEYRTPDPRPSLLCLRGRAIEDQLILRVPVELFAAPVGVRGHDARRRMGESVPDGGMGLLAAAETFEPVGHVVKVFIANGCGRQALLSRERDELLLAFTVNVGIVLVVSFFLDQLVTRAAFPAQVD